MHKVCTNYPWVVKNECNRHQVGTTKVGCGQGVVFVKVIGYYVLLH